MREYITANSLANQVRLLQTVDRKVTVLVEDSSSASYLKNCVVHEHLTTVLVCHKKENLYGVLSILQPGERLIGVADADYERLLGRSAPFGCVWFDHRDLEVFVTCTKAFERVVRDLCNDLDASAIRDACLEAASVIGQWRASARRQGVALTFQGLRPEQHYDAAERRMSREGVAAWLREQNDPALMDAVSPDEVHADRRELVRGHDLSAILAAQFRQDCGVAVGSADVERHLRLAARPEDLEGTDFLRSLADWEARHRTIVLADM